MFLLLLSSDTSFCSFQSCFAGQFCFFIKREGKERKERKGKELLDVGVKWT